MTPPATPDCANCDSANSLEYEYANPGGSIWYICNSCSKRNLVKDGRVVYPVRPTEIDVNGTQMHGP